VDRMARPRDVEPTAQQHEAALLARGVAAPFTAGRELADGEVNAAPAERLRGQVDRGAAVPRPHRFRSIEKGQAHRSASPAPKNERRKMQSQAIFRPAKRFAEFDSRCIRMPARTSDAE